MKQRLLMRLIDAAPTGDTELDWWLIDTAGTLSEYGRHRLAALAPLLQSALPDSELMVLVPGELVLLTSVSIPSRQLRHIKQALPYTVEELIADNIEEVHLALPPIKIVGDQPLPVAVAHHQLLIQWLDQFYSHGLEIQAIVPDTLAVPWQTQSDLFFIAEDRVFHRSDRFAAQAIHWDMFDTHLAMTASPDEAWSRRCVVAGSGADEQRVKDIAARLETAWGREAEVVLYEESAGEILALTAARNPSDLINLRQGGYAVQPIGNRAITWRSAAAAAAAGVVLYAAVAGASGLWFSQAADRVESQTFALYRELFPEQRRVFSPQRQMTAQLRTQGVASGSSLPLLARLADTASFTGLTLEELRLQAGTGVQMQLRAASLEQLGQLQQTLREAGMGAEIRSATEQGEQTVGRLHVTETRS